MEISEIVACDMLVSDTVLFICKSLHLWQLNYKENIREKAVCANHCSVMSDSYLT